MSANLIILKASDLILQFSTLKKNNNKLAGIFVFKIVYSACDL